MRGEEVGIGRTDPPRTVGKGWWVCWRLRSVGKMVGKSKTGVRGGVGMGDKCLWRAKRQRLVGRTKAHAAALSPFIGSLISPPPPHPGERNYKEKQKFNGLLILSGLHKPSVLLPAAPVLPRAPRHPCQLGVRAGTN